MIAIFKREMRGYFTSPVGYIFMAVFLAANGFIFSLCTLRQGVDSSVSTYFNMVMFAFAILIPLLTMKSFSEEKKLKTEQLLMTSPVSITGMVMGKFLSAFTMFALTFLAGCVNFIALYKYGSPNTARLIGYVIGMLLIGAAFCAIGIFVSSLTENQVVAAVGTMAVMLLFLVANFLNSHIDSGFLRSLINKISVYSRFTNFTYGIFDIPAVLYYVSISFVFLFLTVRVYEKRRWA